MMDLIQQQMDTFKSHEENIQRVREFLQILILKVMFDLGAFKNLAFVGGTALRILYDLKRFSEDLDFSAFYKKGYDFKKIIASLKHDLGKYGFTVEGEPKIQNTVQQVMIRFVGLLQELKLSETPSQKLFIRLEVDSNPPKGAKTQISLNNRYFTYSITQYDLPSLFATKLHACFFRKYTKGRDFYDLYWYLGRKVMPNFDLLNNAIWQTEKKKLQISAENFEDFLKTHLEKIDFDYIQKDVAKFLDDKKELQFLNKKMLLSLVNY